MVHPASASDPPGEPRLVSRLPRNFAPLGYRNYFLFWVGHLASNTGRWIEDTGAVWLVYTLTGSPVLLGLLGVMRAVPAFILGPVAGVVADRVDQRRLLFATQGLALVASLSLGLLVAAGRVEVWHAYLQIGLQSAISVFDAAGRQALFPRLVPRTRLAEAVTMSAIAGRSSAFVGPAIGGVAIAGLGVASPFLLNAATYLALMFAVVLMRGVVPRAAVAGSTFVGEFTEGLRHILASPVLSGLLKMTLLFEVFQANSVIITIVGREVLHVGPEGLGGLLSAPALGSIAGLAFLLVLGQSRRQGRFIVFCQLGYAAALAGFALSQDYAASFAALALIGLLDVLATVTRLSVLQLAAPGRMRGRVMSNTVTIARGIGPMAQTQSGILSGALGGPLAAVMAAGALVVNALVTGRGNQPLWRFSRDDPGPESLD
jgi:MFS family permease